ncbi:MAG TPA: anaerobic ribonucleoside-triphosphate reductase [Bacilli bacterium]|nr:anaerobic ribonucleoside-triphosphate reductase [Bacilli bacterium]
MGMFKTTDELINKFIGNDDDKRADYLKRENSNFVYSLPLLRKNISNKAEEEYLMEHILPRELVELYEDGVVYIHDKQLSSYCQSVSCKDVATRGLPSIAKNMLESDAASSIPTLIRHFSNMVTLMSQQVSGAVMLSQMTTVLASFLYEEERNGQFYTDKTLTKLMYQLIYELNLPLRSGSESAFSNCTLEFGKPSEEIKNEYVVIGGEGMPYKYCDIPSEYFDRINIAFIDAMAKGTKNGIPLTFPLITVQIDDEFNFQNEVFLYLLRKMYQWGGVYFENFMTAPFKDDYYTTLNPYIKSKDPSVSRSLCCRLNIDLSVLSRAGGGIFGSSVGNVGAIQVLNLNMNRMLIEFGHDEELLKVKIREYLEIMQSGHMAKRAWVENHRELYPTFFALNENLKNYFNVFAVTGMHEGLINVGYRLGMNDPVGKIFAHELMQYMTEVINEFIVRDKVACGIEYAPAENAGIKLARSDVKWARARNREIFVQGEGDNVFLTSGCMLPFSEEDFTKQIENSAEFQGYATSGSILHHFIESEIEPEILSQYLRNIFTKPINYITLTPTITSCLTCGQKIVAKDAKTIDLCPVCHSDDIASYSRVIGYVRMIARKNIRVDDKGYYKGDYNFWSKARRHDWANRRRFKTSDALTPVDEPKLVVQDDQVLQ